MKKHYKGLTVLLSAFMLAGSAPSHMQDRQMTLQTVQSVCQTPVRQHRQSSSTREPGSRMRTRHFHVGVNYLYNAEGDISALRGI